MDGRAPRLVADRRLPGVADNLGAELSRALGIGLELAGREEVDLVVTVPARPAWERRCTGHPRDWARLWSKAQHWGGRPDFECPGLRRL